MFFFLAVFGIIISCCLPILFQRRKILIHLKRNFNAPPLRPFVGSLHHFPYDVPGLFKTLMDLIKEYGKNVLFVGPLYYSMVVITNPSDVEILLANSNAKSAKKSTEYELLKPWLGTGLLTSEGEKWFSRRRIITPSFHFSILEQFVGVMNRQSDIFVRKLESKVGEGYFNICNYTTLYALDVICEASMGITLNAQSSPNSEYILAVKEITSLIQTRIFSLVKRLPGLYILFPSGRRHNRLIKVLHGFTIKVITERRNTIMAGGHDLKKNKMNFMDMLLHATIDGKPLSDEDIREEVDTFMFEGHDTTTSGIAFTFYELSRHQDIQERAYQEVKDIYESDATTEMTYKKLNEMKYLEMVIKETLRMMPSVPLFARELTEDVMIGNTMIPTGTNLTISVYSMHHDPDNFPDPEKFDPERFSPVNSEKRHPFAYIPFSAGGRNCIGQKFAMLEMKTVVSKILMNYRLLNDDQSDIILEADLILKPSHGINIKLNKR